jgi:hypothetical protein
VSAVDQHAEAHRLKAEHGYGARRIGQELGISRHAATQLLARPLPQPVAATAPVPAARVADGRPTVAEPVCQEQPASRPVAEPVAGVVGQRLPVADPRAEGVVVPAGPVGQAAGAVRFPLAGARSPWLRVDLSGRRGLLADLMTLVRFGLRIPYVVEDVLSGFAAAYHQAVTTGQLAPGQAYDVQIRVRPCRHT